jgi:predicted signal transduction protein with EAL and GGDEF domain
VSRRLTETLRSSDVMARLGGDEFVVMVHEVGAPQQVEAVARKIMAAVIKPITIQGQECRVTASIGISMYPADADDEQSLMKNADTAMYRAKEEGKNTFRFYTEGMSAHSFERLAMESSLRRAFEREEFHLHYQAKLNRKSGAITGVEVLLRWSHPELGLVSPTQFIPIMEESGLIVPVGRWILGTACAQNVAWQRLGLPPVTVAVNLSARQFFDQNLLQDIADALEESELAPELLEFELTETMVMQNAERAATVLAAMKKLGVRLTIDDFGIGFASLANLKRFSVDTMKVDRSFIRDLSQDSEDRAITQAIVTMGKSLQLNVVVEGVETEEQMAFLQSGACDEMQGFYFSHPIESDQFAELLRRNAASQLTAISSGRA